MSTAINNNPANISTLAVQKTFQLIKALNDNNALSLEDKMIAIAESLNDLNARVNGLETPEYLPDIIANSIDTQEIPKIGGCSVIKTGDGAPTVATDFIGQVYIDTTNSKMYFAKAVGNSSNWVLPSTAVVTSWSSTPSNNNVPSEKLVKDSLDNKNAKVTGTSGNLAGFNNNGLLADSGISVSTSWSSSTGSDTKVASEKLVKGAVNDLITEIGNINAFEVATLTTGANPHPDVQSPSTKIIYLTKDSSSTATDPYTEWIYSNNTWEVIGETSMDLSGYKTKQSAVSDPTESGTSLTFISNITQNENGVISPSKKTIQDGTTSQKGVVQLEDSYSSTSTTKAATPNSVKAAYDLANNAIPSSSIATSWSSTTSDSKVPSEKLVKSSLDNKQGTLSFDGTYDASTNKVATESTVTGAINGLATVATSGSYSDLSNKPSIPAAQVNSDWNASSGVAQILHKPSLGALASKDTVTSSDVASGSYNIDITGTSKYLEVIASSSSDFDTLVPDTTRKCATYSINGSFTNGPSGSSASDYWGFLLVYRRITSINIPHQVFISATGDFLTRYSTTYDSTSGKYINWTAWTKIQNASYASKIGTSASHPAIGASDTPVYVNSNGEVSQCTDVAKTSSLGTASAKDVPTSGDASSTQVVLGDDTRLNFENNKKYTVYNSSGDVYYYKVATITSTGPINIASGALFLIMTRDSADNNYVYLAHIRKRDYHNDSAFIGSISKLLGGDFSTQSTIITFYVDKTSELSADFYIKLSGYCGMSVMPLTYGMAGQSSMVMTTASLPSTATEITPNMLPTVQFGGVGSSTVPSYVDSTGELKECALPHVMSFTGLGGSAAENRIIARLKATGENDNSVITLLVTQGDKFGNRENCGIYFVQASYRGGTASLTTTIINRGTAQDPDCTFAYYTGTESGTSYMYVVAKRPDYSAAMTVMQIGAFAAGGDMQGTYNKMYDGGTTSSALTDGNEVRFANLDSSGKVPVSQLPDMLPYEWVTSFPSTYVEGKIYLL